MSKELWCITGDWQLDSDPSFDVKDADGQSVRFWDSCRAIENLLSISKKAGATELFFLGDATEHKAASNLERKLLSQYFFQACKQFRDVYGLPGNHDGSLFATSSSTLEPIGILLSNFYYYDKFSSAIIGSGKRMGVFLPYLHGVPEKEIEAMFEAFVQEYGKTGKFPDYEFFLFGHYGVSGVTSGEANMVLTKDMLALTTIRADRFKRGWMGHIHKAQKIGNISWPGSTYSHDFGERSDRKGFILYDPQTDKEEFIDLKPEHPLFQIPYENTLVLDEDFNHVPVPKGCILKIAGKLPVEQTKAYLENDPRPAVEEYFKEQGATAVFWELEFEREVRAKRSDINLAQPFLQMVDVYLDETVPSWNIGEKDVVMTLAKEILDSQEGYKSKYGHIRLGRVRYRNFLSFIDETLDLSNGIHLIAAVNGTGKSNILGGLYFAFTGNTMTGVNLSAMVHKRASAGSLEVVFYNGEDEYVLTRVITRKPKGGATQKISLLCNGKDVKDGGNNAAQDQTSSLIGFDAAAFSNTIFFMQDDPNSIITIGGRERKAIVGSVFKTNVLKGATESANKFLSAINKTLNDLEVKRETLQGIKFETSIEAMGIEQQEVLSKVVKTMDAIRILRAGVINDDHSLVLLQEARLAASTKLAQNSDITARPDLLKAEWAKRSAELTKSLDDLRAKREASKLVLAGYNEEIPTLKKSIEDWYAEKEKHNNFCNVFQENLKAIQKRQDENVAAQQDWKLKIAALETRIEELTTINGFAVCPTCKQDTAHLHIHNKSLSVALNHEKEQAIQLLQGWVDGMVKLKKDYEAEDTLIDSQAKKLNEFAVKIAGAESRLKSVDEMIVSETARLGQIVNEGWDTRKLFDKEEVEYKTGHVIALSQASEAKDAFYAASKEMTEIGEKITATQNTKKLSEEAITPLEETLKTAETRAAVLESQISQVQNLSKDLEVVTAGIKQAKQEASRFELLRKTFGPEGIQALILDSIRPDLEGRINHYLLALGVTKFRLFIQTQVESETTDNVKETFEFMVDDGVEPFLDVRSYSGGEKQAIKIAIHLALSDIAFERSGIRFPFFALDEIYDGLSSERRKALTRLIFSLQADLVLVMCHIEEVAQEFDSIIELTYTQEEGTKLYAKRKMEAPGKENQRPKKATKNARLVTAG